MQREIKFRAWDWYNKVMKFYTLKQLADEDKFNYDTEFEAIQSGFDNWKWMEFTGIKDKRGNDIYEADVIRIGKKWLLEVRFENGKYFFHHLNNDYGRWGDLHRLHDLDYKNIDWEIIGNVHEHPEKIAHTTPST